MKFKVEVIGHPAYTKEVEADDWQIEDYCHLFYVGVDVYELVSAYPVNMTIVTVITDDIFS